MLLHDRTGPFLIENILLSSARFRPGRGCKVSLVNKQSIRTHLQATYTDADLQAWFDPLRVHVSDAGNIEIHFPHVFFARWFTKERRKNFEREVARLFGTQHKVVYVKPRAEKSAANRNLRKDFREHAVSVAQQARTSAQWSFDSFIFNKKNEFPVSMAREIAATPDNPAHTPFILCGAANCGKTHLLRAMAADIAKISGNSAVYLGTAAELYALPAESDKPGSVKRKLLRYKAVFIDNVHEIANNTHIQQEFINIIDSFREKKKTLVMAFDESFDQTMFDEKLKSRFESGLIVTVKKPDLDVRLRYARAQCAANRLHLKKELLLPLAQRLLTLPSIQGAVAKITAYQNNTDKPVTLADIEKIMANNAITGTPATATAIISQVADAFSLAEADIAGTGRGARVVLARQTAMYLCREFLGVPYAAIGHYFSGKNHATVLYACNKITKMLKSDKNTNNIITQVRKKFLSRTK